MPQPTQVPTHLQHKPIIAVNNYAKIDAIYADNTDTVALSIGRAQFDNSQISAKVWRYNPERWSRQSEELPIHRALDLSILTVAAFMSDIDSAYSLTSLREEIVDRNGVAEIRDYYKKHEHMLKPRLEELRKVLNTFFEKQGL